MLSNVTEKQTNKHGVRCDYIQYLLKLDLHLGAVHSGQQKNSWGLGLGLG